MKTRPTRLLTLSAVLLGACSTDWQRNDLSTFGGPASGSSRALPAYGSQRTSAPVPAITGGTLTILRDGVTAVAADPDRDRVWIVDLPSGSLRAQVALRAGDEPGRVAEGADGVAYVALRRGGAVAAVDVAAGAVRGRFSVCPAPRGVAWERGRGLLHVACTDGTLASLDATGATVRSTKLAPDLRDVVVGGTGLYVTRFRSAEVLNVSPDLSVVTTQQSANFASGTAEPRVAWRAVPTPAGGLLVVHQLHSTQMLQDTPDPAFAVTQGYYGSNSTTCAGGIVRAGITRMEHGTTLEPWQGFPTAVLPVDVALRRDGRSGVFVAAGNASVQDMPQLYPFSDTGVGLSACSSFRGEPPLAGAGPTEQPNGQVTAAAFDGQDRLVVQTREPAALYLIDEHRVVRLPGESRADQGHGIFHGNTGIGIACASCHPEGGDDGHSWNFVVEGQRRTQPLQGTFTPNGPFHWTGDLGNFNDLVGTVFNTRMSGPQLEASQVQSLASFLGTIPSPVRAAMTPDAERGRAIFERADTACASCHSGDTLSDHRLADVGTGGAFRVPSLRGVSLRLPVMHNGCATTMRTRFTDPSCGGGDRHGRTSQLGAQELADLVAYLQVL